MSILERTWVRYPRHDLISKAHMTSERAVYLLNLRSDLTGFRYAFRHEWLGEHCRTHDDGITELEDCYIKMIWGMMDNTRSYYDAVCKIALGI